MAKKYTVEENLLTLIATGYTQKALALSLGVSDRSIRKWLNEGVQPTEENQRRIALAAKYLRHRIKQSEARFTATEIEETYNRRTGKTKTKKTRIKKAIYPLQTRVRVEGQRLLLTDPITKRKRLSNNVHYYVYMLPLKHVFELLRAMRDSRQYDYFKFVYKVPKGGTSLGGRELAKATKIATAPEGFFRKGGRGQSRALSDSELWDTIQEVASRGRIVKLIGVV